MDVTQLILDDHHEQRRLFAILEQIPRDNVAALRALWQRLSTFLEVHAEAEEQFFYPALLHVGEGAGGKADARAETKDAIKDHNEIRNAVAAVANQAVGSDEWFGAIAKANRANSEHMGEEEREGLTDFRLNAPLQLRHDLAVSFAGFGAIHFSGVAPVDKDPKAYVREHGPD
jgi:hypothetical protein